MTTDPVVAKQRVRAFWEATPCGTRGFEQPEASPEFFARLERERDAREPFISRFARFGEWRGRWVLEVGVGAATDFVRFARAGAVLTGVDLTQHAVDLARRRLVLEGFAAEVHRADAEQLPFADGSFDFVYSWGVIHHTADPGLAAREIVRVLKPGGEACVMVYHLHSLVALQCWVWNGLLAARPWRSLREVVAAHIESAGTRAYTTAEAGALFDGLDDVGVTPVVTPYDVRLTRSLYLPPWIRRWVPRRFGWFLVVTGRRPHATRR